MCNEQLFDHFKNKESFIILEVVCYSTLSISSFCNILICRCIQKHSQHNKDEWTQFFRKIYLSLYLKGLPKGYCVRGELETEQRLQHIDPHSSGYSSNSFPTLISNLSDFLSHPGYIII